VAARGRKRGGGAFGRGRGQAATATDDAAAHLLAARVLPAWMKPKALHSWLRPFFPAFLSYSESTRFA